MQQGFLPWITKLCQMLGSLLSSRIDHSLHVRCTGMQAGLYQQNKLKQGMANIPSQVCFETNQLLATQSHRKLVPVAQPPHLIAGLRVAIKGYATYVSIQLVIHPEICL